MKGNVGINRAAWSALLLAALLLVGGCATGGPRPDLEKPGAYGYDEPPPDLNLGFRLGPGDILGITFLSNHAPSTTEYRLQPGDTMFMEFHRNEQLNRNLLVRPDGMTTLPYLGDLPAAGITPTELARHIEQAYRDKKLFDSPELTLSVVGFNTLYKELQRLLNSSDASQGSKDVMVDQEGYLRLPLLPRMLAAGKTLSQAEDEIQAAYADMFGAAHVLVELKKVQSNQVYVLGHVNRPGMLSLSLPATVTQVIAQAGGFNDTSGLSSVVLLRPSQDGRPMAFLVDVADILRTGNLAADRRVQRYDVVYVPPSRIHELNRAVLMGIRNMVPWHSTTLGFNYAWGGGSANFQPFW